MSVTANFIFIWEWHSLRRGRGAGQKGPSPGAFGWVHHPTPVRAHTGGSEGWGGYTSQ